MRSGKFKSSSTQVGLKRTMMHFSLTSSDRDCEEKSRCSTRDNSSTIEKENINGLSRTVSSIMYCYIDGSDGYIFLISRRHWRTCLARVFNSSPVMPLFVPSSWVSTAQLWYSVLQILSLFFKHHQHWHFSYHTRFTTFASIKLHFSIIRTFVFQSTLDSVDPRGIRWDTFFQHGFN